MAMTANINGVEKDITQIRTKINDIYRFVYETYGNINGIWKKTYENLPHTTVVINYTAEAFVGTIGTVSNTSNSITFSNLSGQGTLIFMWAVFKDFEGTEITSDITANYTVKLNWSGYVNGSGNDNSHDVFMGDAAVSLGIYGSYPVSKSGTFDFNEIPSASGQGEYIGQANGSATSGSSHTLTFTLNSFTLYNVDTGLSIRNVPLSVVKYI